MRGLLLGTARAFFFVAFFAVRAAGRRARTGARDFFAPRRAAFAGLRAPAFPAALRRDLPFAGAALARADERAGAFALGGFTAGAFGGVADAGTDGAGAAFTVRGLDARGGTAAGDAGPEAAGAAGVFAFATRAGFATRYGASTATRRWKIASISPTPSTSTILFLRW